MFLYDKGLSYGISKQSVLDFINSDCQIAVAINGTDEIELLRNRANKIPGVDFMNVMLTFSSNYDSEIQQLEKNLKQYFDEENFNKRFSFFKEHAKNKLIGLLFHLSVLE